MSECLYQERNGISEFSDSMLPSCLKVLNLVPSLRCVLFDRTLTAVQAHNRLARLGVVKLPSSLQILDLVSEKLAVNFLHFSQFPLQSHNLLSSISVSTLDLPNLKLLDVSCNRLKALNAADIMFQCAAFCSSIQSLNIGLNKFDDSELKVELSNSGLPFGNALSAIELSTNSSFFDKVAGSVNSNFPLEALGLPNLGLPSTLCQSSESNESRTVSMLACAAKEKDREIRSFDGQTGDFSSLLVPARAEFHLQTLMLRIMLDDDAATHFALIQCLNLSACNLGLLSHPSLIAILQRLPAVNELNLSLNHFPADSILHVLHEAPHSLTKIIIRNAGIAASGLCAHENISSFKFSSLTSIDVSDNADLQGDGFAHLLGLCPKETLLSLNVSNCGIDLCGSDPVDRVETVLSIFRQVTSLRALDVSKNNLGYAAVEAIIRCMSPEPDNLGPANRSGFQALHDPKIRPLGSWASPLNYLNISSTTPHPPHQILVHRFNKWFNSVLVHFCHLTHLLMSENDGLVSLSPSVSCLRRLEVVDMSHCKNLVSIPDELILATQHRKSQLLFFGCHSLEYPPKEVVYQGQDAMLQFIFRIEKVRLSNVKVLVLGNGGTGKRSLLRALANIQDSAKKSFEEMNQLILRQYLPIQNWIAKRVGLGAVDAIPSVSFWSFGGNLEYCPHANLCLSARQCVYVVLFSILDAHEALTRHISNWLRVICDAVGSSKSIRILFVGTQVDRVPPHLLGARKKEVRVAIQQLVTSMDFLSQFDSGSIAVECWFSADAQQPDHKDEYRRLTNKIYELSAELVRGPNALMFPVMYLGMKKEVQKLAAMCEQTKQLPFIKLSDLTQEDGYKILAGSHHDTHKLHALQLLHDAGLLISYTDVDDQPCICVNMNFCIDIFTLFTDCMARLKSRLMFGNESVLSKDELYKLFELFFESGVTSVSWYSSVFGSGLLDSLFGFLVSQGLLLPVSARQFRPDLVRRPSLDSEVSPLADRTLFMTPMLLRAKPNSWKEVFRFLLEDTNSRFFFLFDITKSDIPAPASWGLGDAIRIKGYRFATCSANDVVTASSFLNVMLKTCRDARSMWGFSFLYHVDGFSVYVRLAGDRGSVDFVTIGTDTETPPAVACSIRKLVIELGLKDSPMMFICPLCCASEDYVKSASAHAYHQPQIARFQELGRTAICNQLHQVPAASVAEGFIFQMHVALDPVKPFFPVISAPVPSPLPCVLHVLRFLHHQPTPNHAFRRRKTVLWLDDQPNRPENQFIRQGILGCVGMEDGPEDLRLLFDFSAVKPENQVLVHFFKSMTTMAAFMLRPENLGLASLPAAMFRIVTNRRLFVGREGLSSFLDEPTSPWASTFPSTMIFYGGNPEGLEILEGRPNAVKTTSLHECLLFMTFAK
jgi:hypothetical protein